ncbi:MAG TPA: CPBP family intramembrane glutamic endopeptidase [Acidobacteriaceae bacterium]
MPIPEPTRDEALDIQHDTDPARDAGISRRIPHLGHTLLFFTLALFCLLVATLISISILHVRPSEPSGQHPMGDFLAEMIGYFVTLLVAVPLFATIWHKPFLDGIHWTWRAASRHWWKLILLGGVAAILASLADSLIKSPSSTDLMRMFQKPSTAWTFVIVGSLIAPLMEEIAFRGFLLPALATAYDWIAVERTPAGLAWWQRTTEHTRGAWIFAALFSSAAFTLIHGGQLHWAYGPILVLFIPSLLFAAVRIRLRSVAASTLVHIAYDGFIFLDMIVVTHGFRHLDKLQ